MHLTLWTDYALRTLTYLGAKPDRRATIAEIAERFDVSRSHLMKVVNQLGRQGYVSTLRGKGGGITLARPPEEIGVGEVVRRTEDDFAVMGCLGESGFFCRIEDCCVLRRAFAAATCAFLATLDGYTLADLVAPRASLAQGLGFADAGRPAA